MGIPLSISYISFVFIKTESGEEILKDNEPSHAITLLITKAKVFHGIAQSHRTSLLINYSISHIVAHACLENSFTEAEKCHAHVKRLSHYELRHKKTCLKLKHISTCASVQFDWCLCFCCLDSTPPLYFNIFEFSRLFLLPCVFRAGLYVGKHREQVFSQRCSNSLSSLSGHKIAICLNQYTRQLTFKGKADIVNNPTSLWVTQTLNVALKLRKNRHSPFRGSLLGLRLKSIT